MKKLSLVFLALNTIITNSYADSSDSIFLRDPHDSISGSTIRLSEELSNKVTGSFSSTFFGLGTVHFHNGKVPDDTMLNFIKGLFSPSLCSLSFYNSQLMTSRFADLPEEEARLKVAHELSQVKLHFGSLLRTHWSDNFSNSSHYLIEKGWDLYISSEDAKNLGFNNQESSLDFIPIASLDCSKKPSIPMSFISNNAILKSIGKQFVYFKNKLMSDRILTMEKALNTKNDSHNK